MERKAICYRTRAEKLEETIGLIRNILDLSSETAQISTRKITICQKVRIKHIQAQSGFRPSSICKILGVELNELF